MTEKKPKGAAGMVAIILAVGVAVGMNVITIAILWAAGQRLGISVDSGISENGTQLLIAIFSGVIGALSAYLGFTVGRRSRAEDGKADEPEKPPDL